MMWIGVDLFFVLSGFLITGILLDAPKTSFRAYIGGFYARRVRRILPPYLLLLLTMSLIFGVAWLRHWYLYLGLMNYTGFYFHEVPFISLEPLWSLAVEEQFYLVWPVVVFYAGVRRLPRILIGVLILVPLLRAAFTPWLSHQAFDQYHWFIYRGTVFRCDCLAAGALLTFVWRAHSASIKKYGHLGLIPAALTPPTVILLSRVLPGFSTYGTSIPANVLLYEISLVAVSGTLLWALSGRYTWVLTVAPMRWLARISYTFYLVHQGFHIYAITHLQSKGAAALATGVSAIVFAGLSWHFIERPILHGGNRKAARMELTAAEPEHGQPQAAGSLDSL